jgi:hypothetical protein
MNSDGTSMKFLAEEEKDNYLENLVSMLIPGREYYFYP